MMATKLHKKKKVVIFIESIGAVVFTFCAVMLMAGFIDWVAR
jgi:hypothetical protein